MTSVASYIFCLLAMALASRRHELLAVPIASVLCLVVIAYLEFHAHLGRRVENLVVAAVDVSDRCAAQAVGEVLDALRGAPSNTTKLGGMYGQTVRWSLEPHACDARLLRVGMTCIVATMGTLLLVAAF